MSDAGADDYGTAGGSDRMLALKKMADGSNSMREFHTTLSDELSASIRSLPLAVPYLVAALS
ncbi:MAG: hypothetical protein H0V18_03460 [Pyrinomonadaceae bacterium]|jgi:hypothetical protein|nr:hypothetical protein [Pyrinomonadaceae bacterium]